MLKNVYDLFLNILCIYFHSLLIHLFPAISSRDHSRKYISYCPVITGNHPFAINTSITTNMTQYLYRMRNYPLPLKSAESL